MTTWADRGWAEAAAVGACTLHFEFKPPAGSRSVMAHVWFPATGPAGGKGPVAPGRHPVLLYFPGWGGQVGDNASLLESLARHGFIVVGLSYPAGAGLPDPAVPMRFAPDSAYTAGTAQGNRMVRVQAEDALSVLRVLTKMNKADPDHRFTGRLDTRQAGVMGYSLGGAVAAELAWRDSHFPAVLNLDGWMFSDVATKFFHQPYLVISDDLAPPTSADLTAADAFRRNFSQVRQRDALHQTVQLKKSGGYRITITGASHFTFSDHARANVEMAGPIDPKRALAIVGAYANEFFGKYLAGQPAPLLDQREALFPEAKLEVFSKAP